MVELDRTARDTQFFNRFYFRLGLLGSPLNSRVRGGALASLVSAFIAMVSDAIEDVKELFIQTNPATSTNPDLQDQALGFFERPRYRSTPCEQAFTLLRPLASSGAGLIVPLDAAIQTSVQQDGKVRSYTLFQESDAGTIEIGETHKTFYFKATESGTLGVIAAAQLMEIASGFAGPYVVAGRWTGGADPLSTLGTTGNETIEKWLINNAPNFEQVYRVVGRDEEGNEEFYARCVSRWSEQSTGSTAAAYESWARSYVDPATGSAPFASARVTGNQQYLGGISVAPEDQLTLSGTTYFMGVEVAVSLASGATPATSLLRDLADYLFLKKPHTDKVWVRPPDTVNVAAGSILCEISYQGPASFQEQIHALALSFFRFSVDAPLNYRGLGSTIYISDLVYAIRSLSSDIVDAHVVFTLPGKIDALGNIDLLPYEQINVVEPTTAITVEVS